MNPKKQKKLKLWLPKKGRANNKSIGKSWAVNCCSASVWTDTTTIDNRCYLQQNNFNHHRTGRTGCYSLAFANTWSVYSITNIFLVIPIPFMVRLFHCSGREDFTWLMPAAVISSPPNPFKTACRIPPAPVAK